MKLEYNLINYKYLPEQIDVSSPEDLIRLRSVIKGAKLSLSGNCRFNDGHWYLTFKFPKDQRCSMEIKTATYSNGTFDFGEDEPWLFIKSDDPNGLELTCTEDIDELDFDGRLSKFNGMTVIDNPPVLKPREIAIPRTILNENGIPEVEYTIEYQSV